MNSENHQKSCAKPGCEQTCGLYPKNRIEGVMRLSDEKAIWVCSTCIPSQRTYIRKREWDLWCIFSTDYFCPSDRHDVEWFGEEKKISRYNYIREQLKEWGFE